MAAASGHNARLLALALALLLAALHLHGVVCDPSHTHFAMVSRNAPSWRPDRGGQGKVSAPSLDTCGCGPAPPPADPLKAASLDKCGCPPAPAPSPEDFLNENLQALYPVIQAFKATITSDPRGVTASWVGPNLCDSYFGGDMYKGFYCEHPPAPPGATTPKDNTTLTIASIDFNGYGLGAPSLAGFVDAFPDLALFHANSNNFSGEVPDLTGLPYFYELDLSNNNFSGAFPATVVPLGRLLFLDLRFNRFVGTVPPPVFDLTVVALFLNNNGFYGNIPDNFGSTTAEYLVVANNQFTGPIPRSIYNTSANLSEVLFLNNHLSGCLPYEIGLVEGLTVFDAGGNDITGPIPLSLGCLGLVEELNLAGNQLYGHIPDVLCALAKTGKLQNLSLSDNYFHSVGRRHCLELVRSKVLDVRLNCIPNFPHQRPALECARFYADPPQHCPFVPHIPCDLPGFRPPAAALPSAVAAEEGGGGGGGGN
uniref:Leucine-rich repeat-containing N-terminal plant-type domain-containing protein n=1 Tax=Oryza rufipogon TaxID=4529 RepID=A0A0E0PFH0_ORYRU